MARKILGISKSEMLRMRDEGLSNKDIANIIGVHVATVYNYIGPQGCKMEHLAAFGEKPKEEETQVETPEIKRAVDEIIVTTERVGSKNGNAFADVDYILHTVSLDIGTVPFDELPELATFIVGMVERITREVKK